MARLKYYDVATGTVKYAETIGSNIDDNITAADKTWSSIKIMRELQNGAKIYSNTTEGWNAQRTMIAEANTIYVYTDGSIVDGEATPRLKIGDGLAYLIDAPFVNEEIIDHINNQAIHVSSGDRTSWDSKVRVHEYQENMIFTLE